MMMSRSIGPRALLALFFLFVFIYAFRPISSIDTWWHIKTGEYIVKNKAIPSTDIFSHTAVGRIWITQEWLSEIIYYNLTAIGGLRLLRIFDALLVTGLIYIFYRLFSNYLSPASTITFVTLILLLYSNRIRVRPHIFTFISLTITYIIFFNRGFKRFTMQRIVSLCCMAMVWANLHAGISILPVFLSLFILGEIISYKLAKHNIISLTQDIHIVDGVDGTYLKRLALASILMFIVTLINYNGLSIYRYLFLTTDITRKYGIPEWMSIFSLFIQEQVRPNHFYFLRMAIIVISSIFIVVAYLSLRARRIDLTEALINILFIYMAVQAQRFIELLSFTLIFIVKHLPKRFGFLISKKVCIPLFIICCVNLFINKEGQFDILTYLRNNLTLDIHYDKFPYDAADFIKTVGLKGKLYNPIGWGGYLIYRLFPEVKVSCDGRVDVYTYEVLDDQRAIYLDKNREYLLEKYDVDMLVVPKGFYPEDKPIYNRWIGVYQGTNANVYLKMDKRNMPNFAKIKRYYKEKGKVFPDITL